MSPKSFHVLLENGENGYHEEYILRQTGVQEKKCAEKRNIGLLMIIIPAPSNLLGTGPIGMTILLIITPSTEPRASRTGRPLRCRISITVQRPG